MVSDKRWESKEFSLTLIFVIFLILCSIFLAGALAFILLDKFLLAVVFLIMAGVAGYIFYRFKCFYHNKRCLVGADIIFDQLLKRGIKSFNIDSIRSDYGLSDQEIYEISKQVYAKCLRLASKDFRIGSKDKAILDAVADKLNLSRNDTLKIQKENAIEIYQQELMKATNDGILTNSETTFLEKIRSDLGLTLVDVSCASQKEILDGYKKIFARFANFGIISVQECDQLINYAKLTGIEPSEAAHLAPEEAYNLYRRTITIICQDGVIEEKEIQILDRLEHLLKLPDDLIKEGRKRINKTQRLAAIRKGNLPVIKNHNLILKSGELCHWLSPCVFTYQTSTQEKSAEGDIVITNKRLIFSSDTKNFEIRLSKIINFRKYANGMRITFTCANGTGFYEVNDPDEFECIIEYLAKKRNFIISENSDAVRTRYIPDDVKVEVWQRDGGRCVKCGATDYLEYDHIIPHSLGGSNSANNVQLLCRKCNLAKGANVA